MTAKVVYLNCLSVRAQGKINPDHKKLGFFIFIEKLFSLLTLYALYTYLNSAKIY